MRLDVNNTDVRAFNLPIPHEKATREVEDIARRAKRTRNTQYHVLTNPSMEMNIVLSSSTRVKYQALTHSQRSNMMKEDTSEHFLISETGGTRNTHLLNTLLTLMNHQVDLSPHLWSLYEPFKTRNPRCQYFCVG
jgi:hypothetical protein